MKITIDYDGARAICKVDSKYISQCHPLIQAQALSAFRCIEQHLKREGYYEKLDDERKQIYNVKL